MQFLTGENRPPLVNPIYPAYLKDLEWAGSHGISDPFLGDGLLYNLQGQSIRKPEGIYIEDGVIKYKIN